MKHTASFCSLAEMMSLSISSASNPSPSAPFLTVSIYCFARRSLFSAGVSRRRASSSSSYSSRSLASKSMSSTLPAQASSASSSASDRFKLAWELERLEDDDVGFKRKDLLGAEEVEGFLRFRDA